jgi:hypothetical protein
MPFSPFLKQKIDECRQMYNLGTPCNDLIETLHDQGLSLDEVCTVLAAVLEIEPAEAHIFVADNPIWVELIDPNSPIAGEVMEVLDRDGNVEDLGDGVLVYREPLIFDIVNKYSNSRPASA